MAERLGAEIVFAKKWKGGDMAELWQQFRDSSAEIEALIPRLELIRGREEEVRDQIIGQEGTGAEIYWPTWANLIPDEQSFSGRD